MRRYLILIIITLFTITLPAQTPTQTVRGKVTDLDSKSGLPGANVIILNSNPLIGAISDAEGNFILNKVPVGRHSFKISYMGYKTVIRPEVLISSGKEVFLSLELEEEVVQAGEVEIKATTEKDKPVNSMAMISARSLSVEESRRYAGSADDPMRAVSNFAGVAASADAASNEIVIRGNSPKGLLWRVDGIDIPNPNHFAYIGASGGGITMLSSQVLNNSDFYTAAFPAQFGNALSGVFDMRFRNGNSNRHEFALQAGIQGLDLAAEGPFSKKSQASYLFNYRYSILAFMQLIDPAMKNKIPQYHDLSFKLNFPTRKAGTFSLVGIGGISRSQATPGHDTTQWKTLDDQTKSMLNNNMGAIGLIHQINVTKKSLLKTWLSATYSDIHSQFDYMTTSYTLVPQDYIVHQVYRFGGGMAINTKFGKRHTNRTGFTYSNMFYNIDFRSRNPFNGTFAQVEQGKGNTDIVQAFTESKFDLSDKITLETGLHLQYFLLNRHFAAEPRLGFKWQVTTRHSLSLGYGMHSQIEDVGLYLAEHQITPGEMVQPNRQLDFSKAHHFVLGYDFLVNPVLRLKAEAYYQFLYDIPVMAGNYYSLINSDGGYSSDKLENEGTGKNIGIDLTFEKFLSHQYYFLATVSLFDSKYKGGDGIERNTRYNSNYVINVLAGKEWTIRKKNILGVNLKSSVTGGQYYVPIDLEQSKVQHTEVLDQSKAYETRLPDFYYVDLTITYRTNHKKFSGIWAVQVKNLLNQKPVIGYVYNGFKQCTEPVTGMGILPFISYKIEF
ncbi:MAG: TonB-dependent receptor [Bacteroidales bacterium]